MENGPQRYVGCLDTGAAEKPQWSIYTQKPRTQALVAYNVTAQCTCAKAPN